MVSPQEFARRKAEGHIAAIAEYTHTLSRRAPAGGMIGPLHHHHHHHHPGQPQSIGSGELKRPASASSQGSQQQPQTQQQQQHKGEADPQRVAEVAAIVKEVLRSLRGSWSHNSIHQQGPCTGRMLCREFAALRLSGSTETLFFCSSEIDGIYSDTCLLRLWDWWNLLRHQPFHGSEIDGIYWDPWRSWQSEGWRHHLRTSSSSTSSSPQLGQASLHKAPTLQCTRGQRWEKKNSRQRPSRNKISNFSEKNSW